MSEQIVTLRLQANNSRLVPPVRESREEVKKLGDDARRAGTEGGAGMRQLGDGAKSASSDLGRLQGSARNAFGAVAALASLSVAKRLGSEFLSAADRAGQLEARMRLATSSQQEFNYAMERSQTVARSSYKSINDIAEVAINSAGPMRQLGYSIRDTLDLSEALSLSLVISAANQQKSASAIEQFSKAMQTGVLRGEQFQTILQTAPRYVTALEDALGKTRAELIKMAEDGQLTVAELTKVSSQLGRLRDETESMPTTIEDAWIRFGDGVQKYAGDLNKAYDVTGKFVAIIDATADNLGNITAAVGVLAVAYGGRLVSSMAKWSLDKAKAIVENRTLAVSELEAARAAEAHAAARLASARAGMAGAAGIVQAEAAMAAATARTAAATQAASIAMTAKAAATRAASAAMAMFGGGLGLAITALTLFVMWVVNSKAKADELAQSVTTGFQDAIKTLQGFNREGANEAFSGLANSIELVDQAKESLDQATESYRLFLAQQRRTAERGGYIGAGAAEEQKQLAEALERARVKYDQLSEAAAGLTRSYAELVLEKAGVVGATAEQRSATEQMVRSLTVEGQTLEQVKPLLQEHIQTTYGIEAANRLAAASFDQVGNAAATSAAQIKEATDKIAEGLSKQLATAELRLVEQTQGKAAALREALARDMAEKGIAADSDEGKRLAEINEKLIAVTLSTERHTKATQAATSAASEAKRKAEEHRKELDQQAESQRRYADEAERLAAALDGPLAEAEVERKQRIADLDGALAKHLITQDTYNQLVATAIEQERRRAAEIAIDQAAPQALLDTMTGELQVLTMMGPARERYQRQLRAEQDMRRAVNDANRAGAKINDEVTDSLVAQARTYADLSVAIEEQVANLYELADVAVRSTSDASGLFADMLTNNLDKSKSFFSQLKDIFKKGFRDLLATLMEQSFVRPIQDMLTNAITGAFNGAGSTGSGGWMSQLAGLLTGGRNLTGTGAQMAGAGWMGTAMATGTGMAAGAGSLMGFGNNMDVFTNIAASSGSGAMGQLAAAGGGLMALAKFGKFATSGLGLGLGSALGAIYGWNQGGDTAGKLLGAAAYGTAGYAGMIGIGAASAASTAVAGGASILAAGKAALSAIPVAGWVALGGIALNKLTGGGLFGTKYATQEQGTNIDVGAGGGSASAWEYQTRKKSLFRGTARRTVTSAASDEVVQAANDLYTLISQTAQGASEALGVATANIISGSFKTVYDKSGNLKEELATVLGRTYKESFEEFGSRLQAENIIAQVGQLDSTASAIAERWRTSAETLLDGAQFLLAAAADFSSSSSILSEVGLSRLTDLIEHLQLSGESMTEAYERVMGGVSTYAGIVAEASTEIATSGFSNFAKQLLQIRQEERQRTRVLQEQAKALGLTAAREQDLATVREAAQRKTDALILGLESELIDLAINRLNDQIQQLGGSLEGAGNKLADFIASLRLSDTLSPESDATRRGTARSLMDSAAAAGNIDDFTKYATEFLEVSRALNASSKAYLSDYELVQRMAAQMAGNSGAADGLAALYEQRAALQAQVEAAARLERAQRIAQGVADLVGVRGGDPLALLQSLTGISGADLARDLGMSTDELVEYLAEQQTDISDLADILYDLPTRIASELVSVLVDRMAVPAGVTTPAPVLTAPQATGGLVSDAQGDVVGLLSGIRDGIDQLRRASEMELLR